MTTLDDDDPIRSKRVSNLSYFCF